MSCTFTWNNRTPAPHAQHTCHQTLANHIYHKCSCGRMKRDPHPKRADTNYAQHRDQIAHLVDQWEKQCGDGYKWQTSDVIDFIECNLKQLPHGERAQ